MRIKLATVISAILKSFSPLPAKSIKITHRSRPTMASIAATVKDHHLDAFVPSAHDNEYDYSWKIFKDGKQIGQTIEGIEIHEDLPDGDYNLHLSIEDKADHHIVSTASVTVHAS